MAESSAAGVAASILLIAAHAVDVRGASPAGAQRPLTVQDMARLRYVDSLSVAPDGSRFAVLVRQGDPVANEFRLAWYVINARDDAMRYVGDGGEAELATLTDGRFAGGFASRESRWSPDGKWIAYLRREKGERQLWRSSADGQIQQQLTHSRADVHEFVWRSDGQALYFSVGTPRATRQMLRKIQTRGGYRYDDDLYAFTDFMMPERPADAQPGHAVWVVALEDGQEQPAGAFGRTALAAHHPIECRAEQCSGAVEHLWKSRDGRRVFIWRREGILGASTGFYSWNLKSRTARPIFRSSMDYFWHCDLAARDQLVCARDTAARPPQLVTLDLNSGAVRVIADLNPEFRHIRLGRAERFEWNTPQYEWSKPGGKLAGIYPDRAFGYVLYPADFDPRRKYPVFISPYAAIGFDNLTNAEHALHVYAAHGFIVLSTQFPMPTEVRVRLGDAYMEQLYSAQLGFPHLTMLAESTLAALDSVAARGFVDQRRVGIGGVSHGTFVPLYMLQRYDRIAAMSISGAAMGQFEYYWPTRKGRTLAGPRDVWPPKPEGEGLELWRQIELADHVEQVEAPILMNLPAHETFGVLRLIRHMADAGKPYDAYVFADETHLKWQPAHLQAIQTRNLDWFRFWLQGYEDPPPEKAGQYARWRGLREH